MSEEPPGGGAGQEPPPKPARKSTSRSSKPAKRTKAKKASAAKGRKPNQIETAPPMGRATVPPALHDPERREEWGLPADEDERGLYMVELNLRYKDGLEEASKA